MNSIKTIKEDLEKAGISYTYFNNEFVFALGYVDALIRAFSDESIEYRVFLPEPFSKELYRARNSLYDFLVLNNEINRYNFFSDNSDQFRNISRLVLFIEDDTVDFGFIGYHTSSVHVIEHMNVLSEYLTKLIPCINRMLSLEIDNMDAIKYCKEHGLLPE